MMRAEAVVCSGYDWPRWLWNEDSRDSQLYEHLNFLNVQQNNLRLQVLCALLCSAW